MLVKLHSCDPLCFASSTNGITSKSAMMHVYQHFICIADKHAIFYVSVYQFLDVGLFLPLLLQICCCGHLCVSFYISGFHVSWVHSSEWNSLGSWKPLNIQNSSLFFSVGTIWVLVTGLLDISFVPRFKGYHSKTSEILVALLLKKGAQVVKCRP